MDRGTSAGPAGTLPGAAALPQRRAGFSGNLLGHAWERHPEPLSLRTALHHITGMVFFLPSEFGFVRLL